MTPTERKTVASTTKAVSFTLPLDILTDLAKLKDDAAADGVMLSHNRAVTDAARDWLKKYAAQPALHYVTYSRTAARKTVTYRLPFDVIEGLHEASLRSWNQPPTDDPAHLSMSAIVTDAIKGHIKNEGRRRRRARAA